MNRFSETFYKNLLDNLYDGVYFVDKNRVITYWNKSAEIMTGYRADEVIGSKCQNNILNHMDCDGAHLCNSRCPLFFTLEDGNLREAEVFMTHKNGQKIPIKIRVSPIFDNEGNLEGAVEIFSDNSSAQAAYEMIDKLREMAFVDEITGLPNKKYMEMKIENLLQELENHKVKFGVIVITLKNYEALKKECGQEKANNILNIVSKTLTAIIAPYHILGCYDTNSFIVIIPNVTEKEFDEFKNRVGIIINSCNLGMIKFSEKEEEPVNICFAGRVIDSVENIKELFN
ncbi:MAG: diguanylate cyclase [Candidatus Muiribacteriota bacterium]|jgi:PAS domain S-box-containing protein/diguanylate cyclase (GGDEF)-like protein